MAKYTKAATKKTGKKVTAKKAATKRAVSKKKPAAKKAGAKKAVPKKKVAIKKSAAVKKSAVVKKKTAGSTRKPAARVTKTNTSEKTKPENNKIPAEILESNLPPVEEKSPEIIIPITSAAVPGMDKKSTQRAAVRNYDNHHIRLSTTRKGGIKPTGKKPMW